MKYNVRILPADVEFPVYDDVSILESAIKSNVYIEHGCMNGNCGSCKAKIKQGKIKQLVSTGGLSESEVRDGYILTCCTEAVSDVELWVNYYPELASIKKSIQPCKIDQLIFPADDVAILKLKLPPAANFKYVAGQYVQLIINGSRRSYSIANIPDTYSGIELHIRNITNGLFSKIVFNDLQINQLLRLEGPLGSFFVHTSNSPIIFLAGGTGFAPVKSMVEQLLRDNSKRKIYIYWGASSIAGFYIDIPHEWQNENKNVKYVPVLSGDEEWDGRRGLVHTSVLEDFDELTQFEVYACGSDKMIEIARKDFVLKGLKASNFYSDAFVSSDYSQKLINR